MRGMASVLITGASGFVGAAACRAFSERGFKILAWTGAHPHRLPADIACRTFQVDLGDRDSIRRCAMGAMADAVIHCGAMSSLDECETHPSAAHRINVESTRILAAVCAEHHVPMIFTSTDQVFDGERGMYQEHDQATPLHVYGRTKLAAERVVASLGLCGLTLRLSLVFGPSPSGTRSASDQILSAVMRGESSRLFVDEYRTPVFVHDAANVMCECVERMMNGDDAMRAIPGRILHLGGPERLSRHAFGLRVAEAYRVDASLCVAVCQSDVTVAARRPSDVSLDSSLAQRVLRMRLRDPASALAMMAREPSVRPGAAIDGVEAVPSNREVTG